MILLIEPVSTNIDMYVPAYPLPLMEIASYAISHNPDLDIRLISIPMDLGLPINGNGIKWVYGRLLEEIAQHKPVGIGISCTAISQARETIRLCEKIKKHYPQIFLFVGGYFATLYYEEMLLKTEAIDLIIQGEGERSALEIMTRIEQNKPPLKPEIPNLIWRQNNKLMITRKDHRFDLDRKPLLNVDLLKHPTSYTILPYAFSRGCHQGCRFCMEKFMRPKRVAVPHTTIVRDLQNLISSCDSTHVIAADAMFESYDLIPFFNSQKINIIFETRCDTIRPATVAALADTCSLMALGFESASYHALKRMNKVKSRSHYDFYLANTLAIFKEATRLEIPVAVFMIAGFPGDTVEDLEANLSFAKKLAQHGGPGGHIFKIGECRVYPGTPLYDMVMSMPDVRFDNDGVFGNNVVRQSSEGVDFAVILKYMEAIFNLSLLTPKLQNMLSAVMPFFRLPPEVFSDETIPNTCFNNADRSVFNAKDNSLILFRKATHEMVKRLIKTRSDQRSTRELNF